MQYNNGDQLLYQGFSGIYRTIAPDVPTGSKTITFNFAACTDADNNNYSIVQIGTQNWMAENLNVGIKIKGTQTPTNNGIIEKFCYNDDLAECTINGGLYRWNEMMQYVYTEGVQGICPTGWHLPTNGEWTELTSFLGDELVAGGKMKETGFTHWVLPNIAATNSSGFTALPGGFWQPPYGPFLQLMEYAYFWSSSQNSAADAWDRALSSYSALVHHTSVSKQAGFSVRCLRDF